MGAFFTNVNILIIIQREFKEYFYALHVNILLTL